jgi:hypothetical protein
MKVPYDEGSAPHIGPESCVYARKSISEALTGGMRAGLLSCERFYKFRVSTPFTGAEDNIGSIVMARCGWTLRGQRTCARIQVFSIGNREVPRLAVGDGPGVGAVNPEGARQR